MNDYLLDTHAFLWLLGDRKRMTPGTLQRLGDPEVTLFLSVASAWEMSIKAASGRLDTPESLVEALAVSRIEPLGITLPHAEAAGQLVRHHGDPFDRMLIAQAHTENLTLVTRDSQMSRYGVTILPA